MKYFLMAVLLWVTTSLFFTFAGRYFEFNSLDFYVAFQGVRIILSYFLDSLIIFSVFFMALNPGRVKKIVFFIFSIILALTPAFPLLQAFGFGEGFVICDKKYFPEKEFSYDFCKFYGQGLINLFLSLLFTIFFVLAIDLVTKAIKSIHREKP